MTFDAIGEVLYLVDELNDLTDESIINYFNANSAFSGKVLIESDFSINFSVGSLIYNKEYVLYVIVLDESGYPRIKKSYQFKTGDIPKILLWKQTFYNNLSSFNETFKTLIVEDLCKLTKIQKEK